MHLTFAAQTKAHGLFCTVAEFRQERLCYSGSQVNIKIHDVFKKKTISITSPDSNFILLKRQVFGYMDLCQRNYRFFQNESYLILNPREKILLYRRTKGTGLRDSPLTDAYFFSKEADSEILSLKRSLVRSAFSDTPEFENKIAFYFRSDEELIQYDPLKKQFKLNQLLEQTKK